MKKDGVFAPPFLGVEDAARYGKGASGTPPATEKGVGDAARQALAFC